MTFNLQHHVPGERPVTTTANLSRFLVTAEDLPGVFRQMYQDPALRLKTVTATDNRAEAGVFRIMYVFGVIGHDQFVAPYIEVSTPLSFPSLVTIAHEVSWYEREIMTMFGLQPVGHPLPRRITLHENWPADAFPLRKDFDWNTRPVTANVPFLFQRIEGEGVYEIPVGPIHAGVIEPGHFRFSVAGEEIIKLEPRLGYKHRGVEKLFETLPQEKLVALAERVSGDSSFAHSWAFCQAMETLTGTTVPDRALWLRTIYAELERLANHLNDIGLVTLGTAYNFGHFQCARLREAVMQWHEKLTGHRFLRGTNQIGGVANDITPALAKELNEFLVTLEKEFVELISIVEESAGMINRLEGSGVLSAEAAKDHGVVGIVAKSFGWPVDARKDHPYGKYSSVDWSIPTHTFSDVYGRWIVRVKEVPVSIGIIKQALERLPSGSIMVTPGALPKDATAVGVVETWRGDVVYVVVTDASGAITRVQLRDPSWLHWHVFPYAVKDNVVLDFPLINKSFNLSYCGCDK